MTCNRQGVAYSVRTEHTPSHILSVPFKNTSELEGVIEETTAPDRLLLASLPLLDLGLGASAHSYTPLTSTELDGTRTGYRGNPHTG